MLQTTIRPELLPDIFHIAIPTNLCRAQLTWYWWEFFWWRSGWKNKSNSFKFTSGSSCCWRILGRLFPCFVCLFKAHLAARKWIFELSSGWWQMSPSSASLPAVAEWDSQGQVSSFSIEKKKKLNMNSLCSVSRVVLEIFCSGGSYLRTIQTQAFP